MRIVIVAAVAALSLLAPADALAHATLVRTSPQNAAVLAKAPRAIVVTFDDTVRVGPGNAVVANATGTSVAGGEAAAHGRILTIPVRQDLADGAYSVRWSIVSDDGHKEEGVLAFGIGTGGASLHSVLGASASLTWSDVVLRTLATFGILVGGGAVAFALLTRSLLGDAVVRPLAQLLFVALLLAFVGSGGLQHSAASGTRFDLVLKATLVVALVGGAAAALAQSVRRLVLVAGSAALLLLVSPTLAGHALDRNQPRVLSAIVDLVHVSAAAVWLGGLAAVVYVVPRATQEPATRRAVAHRFSSAALVAVGVLGATGLLRALTELQSVSQVWSTSYGRALLVKTAIFVPLFGVGFANRTVLLDTFARLRRSASFEIVAIAGIVVAVAFLTELRPGIDAPKAAAAAVPEPPKLPPRDAVVDARELGTLAVAIAREPDRTTVTLVGPDGNGADAHAVTIGGVAATACGSGCYRGPASARIAVDGKPIVFGIPARAPDASTALAGVTRAYRDSHTIVFDERLASSPTDAETTRFTVEAPHRLAYVTRGGAQAIVIGARRWDRNRAGGRWIPTGQTPLDVTQPYWQSPTNVHEIADGTFTFLDRRIPAWFHVTVANGLPSVQRMTAASHFMVDRYVGFDVPVTVSPPSR